MKITRQKVTALIVFSLLLMAFMPGGKKAKKPICLNHAYSFKERAADLVMGENGTAKSLETFDLNNEIIGDNELTLKLEKKGSNYTAYYSTDGKNFELLGTADRLLEDIRAGLIECNGIVTQYMKSTFWFDSDATKPDTPVDISFNYFRIKNNGLK